MKPKLKYSIHVFLGISVCFVFCEYLVYFLVLRMCSWPELDPKTQDLSIAYSNEEPVKVMILADTHLLGSRKGHWLDKLRREWQMHRAFQTALTLFEPELVFVLGDLTDEGLFCSTAEFEYYAKRFYSLFEVPARTKLISPYRNQQFVTAFKSPPVQLISVRGNHFVLVNSMALEGDGCFLCKPAEHELTKLEKNLKCARAKSEGKCDTTLNTYSKPILMQHYPLYRESDAECNDFDAAPSAIKNEKFREKRECLSKEATTQLLHQIKPRVSFSGHTHHGCTRPLPNGGLEFTIPSFSWRNKDNPNFGMGVFTPNNYAFGKCELPKETSVVFLYIFGILALLIWVLFRLYLVKSGVTKQRKS